MKYQAVITINISGVDAYDVAEQHRSLAELTAELSARHGDARLVVKTRRDRAKARAAPPPRLGAGFEIVRVRYVG